STDRARNWTRIYNDNKAIDHANQGLHTCAIGCDPTDSGHLFFGLEQPLETFNATAHDPANINFIGYVGQGERATLDAGHGDFNYILFRHGFNSIVCATDGGYYTYHPDPGHSGP